MLLRVDLHTQIDELLERGAQTPDVNIVDIASRDLFKRLDKGKTGTIHPSKNKLEFVQSCDSLFYIIKKNMSAIQQPSSSGADEYLQCCFIERCIDIQLDPMNEQDFCELVRTFKTEYVPKEDLAESAQDHREVRDSPACCCRLLSNR